MAGNRGGEIQIDLVGMGQNSSLGRAPRPFFSVRLEHLGHVGKLFSDFIGGSMIWDQLSSLTIKWGENETIKYSELKPGWDYRWEIGTWDFVVTDDLGNKTSQKISTFSDLGICWDILESPQFSIHFSAKFEDVAFLPAWKLGNNPFDTDYPKPPDRLVEVPQCLWGEFDKYLKDTMHVKFGVLIDKITLAGGEYEDNTIIDLDLSGCVKTSIIANHLHLSSTANFDISLKESDLHEIGQKKYRETVAETYIIGNFLMIRLFASIHDMSKPVLEPWMLWHMWQWFGSSGVTIRRDRVFDLSPCWG